MTCHLCGKEIGDDFYAGLKSRHRACHRQRMKDLRREDPEKFSKRERDRYTGVRREKILNDARQRIKDNPVKRSAHTAVSNAVRDGRLHKPDRCSNCAVKGRIEAHHPDYKLPLSVIWLCAHCHRRLHAADEARVSS